MAKMNEETLHIRDIICIRIILDFRLKLIVRNTILVNQVIVIQCSGLIPHEYNVLQIWCYKSLVFFQQIV